MGGNGVMGDFSYVEKPIKYQVSDIHSRSERRVETFRSPNYLFGIKITRGFHGIPLISPQILKKNGVHTWTNSLLIVTNKHVHTGEERS